MTIIDEYSLSRGGMNATNYYVSTSRVVIQGDPDSQQTWQVTMEL